jgi:hypothetical protein
LAKVFRTAMVDIEGIWAFQKVVAAGRCSTSLLKHDLIGSCQSLDSGSITASARYDQRLDGLRQCISLISVGSRPPYDALQPPIVRAFAERGRRCLARFGLDVACSSLVHLAFKLSNNLEGRYESIR